MELFEKVKKSETIYDGKIFTVKKEVVELPDGSEAERETVVHVGGVGVIAINDEGKIPMVRQYRNGIEEVTLEIPAGKLERGEDPKLCGRRELKEETGYSAKKFELLFRMAPTPAYCGEILYVFRAEGLEFEGQKLDTDEYLEIEYYTPEELKAMVYDGTIIDAKTMAAVMMI